MPRICKLILTFLLMCVAMNLVSTTWSQPLTGVYKGHDVKWWLASLESTHSSATVQNRTRWYAAYALGQLGSAIGSDDALAAEATEVLGRRLLDVKEYEYVRCNCAWALGQIGNPQAVGPLTESLSSSLDLVRRSSSSALGLFGPAAESAVEALKTQTTESITVSAPGESPAARPAQSRAKAAAAIIRITPTDSDDFRDAVGVLKEMIASTSVRNRQAALDELVSLGNTQLASSEEGTAGDDTGRTAAYKAVIESLSILPYLVEKSRNDDLARSAGIILSQWGLESQVEKLLASTDSHVRFRVIRIYELCTTVPVDLILPFVSDSDPSVAAAAITVLAREMDNPQVEEAVVKAVDAPSPIVSKTAAAVIKKTLKK